LLRGRCELPDLNTTKCPYCAEEIKGEAKKCKHCGEWLNKNEEPEKSSTLTVVFGIVTFIAFAFIGFLMWGWTGLVIGIFLWLVGAGSIGLSRDISDSGEVARKQKKN